MSEKKSTQTIQIRIGQRTSDSMKEWVNNQVNPNESAKRIIEHFIRIYGTADIDSDEIQILMARELLMSKGELKGDFPKAPLAPLDKGVKAASEFSNEPTSTKSLVKHQEEHKVKEENPRQVMKRGKINV